MDHQRRIFLGGLLLCLLGAVALTACQGGMASFAAVTESATPAPATESFDTAAASTPVPTPVPPAAEPTEVDACQPGHSPFVVLMYHRLQRGGGGSAFSVPARKLREQLAWLSEQGYHSITLGMIDKFFREGKPLPPKSVLFTFDDNHPSDYEIGAPLLEEYNFRGVFFVVGMFMTPKVRARYEDLRRRGHEIGSHTWSHQYLTKRHCRRRWGCCGHRGGCTIEDARFELTKSFDELRPMLGDTPVLAWPGNFYSPELVPIAIETGYKLLFACERQVKLDGVPYVFPAMTVSPLEIFRLGIDGRATLRHFQMAVREQVPLTISGHPTNRYCVPQREETCSGTTVYKQP
jgi:peptidoglycan/xylan/chitin deacetylase (PgdA/CDA1 family)